MCLCFLAAQGGDHLLLVPRCTDSPGEILVLEDPTDPVGEVIVIEPDMLAELFVAHLRQVFAQFLDAMEGDAVVELERLILITNDELV